MTLPALTSPAATVVALLAPSCADVVVAGRAAALRSEGRSWTAVADTLNREGLTPVSAVGWSGKTLHRFVGRRASRLMGGLVALAVPTREPVEPVRPAPVPAAPPTRRRERPDREERRRRPVSPPPPGRGPVAPAGGRWWAAALCRTPSLDAEMFYDEAPGSANDAKSWCRRCPVRVDCLVDALVYRDAYGIWGGTGEPVRRMLQTKRADHPVEDFDAGCGCPFCRAVVAHFEKLDGVRSGPVVSYGPNARCGTAAKFGRGCRCEACAAAKHEQMRRERARARATAEEAAAGG